MSEIIVHGGMTRSKVIWVGRSSYASVLLLCNLFTSAEADVSVNIGDLTLIAAPQAVRVLAKLPDVFAELVPETETETETKEAATGRAEMIVLARVVCCFVRFVHLLMKQTYNFFLSSLFLL